MDTPFSIAQWEPSKPQEQWETPPSDSTVTGWIESLNAQTTDIAAHPYDPNSWLNRAETRVKLRYPELAVGDAYKAVMMCQTLLSTLTRRPWYRLGYRTGFLMTDRDACSDSVAREEQTYATLQKRAQDLIHANLDYMPAHKRGRVILRQYPWIHERHLMRSDELIKSINRELAAATRSMRRRKCCVVKRFAFGRGVGARDGEDLLGVFATRDIAWGENIVYDKSRVWGCNGSDSNEPISKYLPSDDLDDRLQWIRHKVGRFAANTIVRSRLLIRAVTDGAQHPLDHPLIARLTPTYCPGDYQSFDLEKDIAVMNQGKSRSID